MIVIIPILVLTTLVSLLPIYYNGSVSVYYTRLG